MKRLLISLIITLALLVNPLPLLSDIRSIQRLIIRIDDIAGDGFCTTFSINREKGYWVTAAHCTGLEMPEAWHYIISGQVATPIKIDRSMDLAILVGPKAGSLWLQPIAPKGGELINIVGYLDGSPFLSVLEGSLANPDSIVLPDWWVHNAIFETSPLDFRGVSGGPIMLDGKVISVMQGWAEDYEGNKVQLGAVYEDLREFTEGFWDR